MERRYWAMRTSRDDKKVRDFILNELREGKLRQGWAYDDSQNLIEINQKITMSLSLTEIESEAWRHWRLLGEKAHHSKDAMSIGDIILVPNMPENGYFSLCEIIGDYYYDINHNDFNDLRHVREVKLLTHKGVSNVQKLVTGELRKSFKCQSRLWSLDNHAIALDEIITLANEGDFVSLLESSNATSRAESIVKTELDSYFTKFAASVTPKIKNSLQAAEWEKVLQLSLKPLMQDVQVHHTGGRNEKGADITVEIPNPFFPDLPWQIAIQIKNYVGEIGLDVLPQIEQIILERKSEQLLGVILASTEAKPSEPLISSLRELSKKHGVRVQVITGDDFMKVIARGLFVNYRNSMV